jgi:hypothetical protein
MTKAIGPTFRAELAAAGLTGLPFAWGDDGSLTFDARMTPDQVAAVQAIYAAHDPTKIPPPPYVKPTPVQWLDRLPDATQDAIYAASLTNATVAKLLSRANGHTEGIDVTDQKVINGVNYLRSQNLLTGTEKALLLAP